MFTLGRSLHPRRLEISMIHRAEETLGIFFIKIPEKILMLYMVNITM